MKEVILYVYGFGYTFVVSPTPLEINDFKGRMIGVPTELFAISPDDFPKEGDVVCDTTWNRWLVVELCDSAMKSFQ